MLHESLRAVAHRLIDGELAMVSQYSLLHIRIGPFILDYEFSHQIELATQEELEKLEVFNYEYLPEKIMEVNKVLLPKGYGLFSYPNSGDYFVLFIAKLDDIKKLLQEELLFDDRIPFQERCIKYYG